MAIALAAAIKTAFNLVRMVSSAYSFRVMVLPHDFIGAQATQGKSMVTAHAPSAWRNLNVCSWPIAALAAPHQFGRYWTKADNGRRFARGGLSAYDGDLNRSTQHLGSAGNK